MKIRSFLAAVLGLALTSCTPADLTAPKTEPTTGTVVLGVTPFNVTGLTCNIGNGATSAPIVPMQPHTMPPGTFTIRCNAPGHEEGVDPVVVVEVGRTSAAKVVMVKSTTPPPPLDSTSVLRLETPGVTAKVDSVFRYPLKGERTTLPGGSTNPFFSMSTKGDGSSIVLWISATGRVTKPVEWTPAPREVKTLLVDLMPIPPVISNKGVLGVASIPTGMAVKIYKFGSSVEVASGTTNFQRELEAGLHTVDCIDPSGKYFTVTKSVGLTAGHFEVVNCPMTLIPPSPPEQPTTGTLVVVSHPSGMTAKVSRMGIDGKWVLVSTATTDTSLLNRSPGSYRSDCTDPSGKYVMVFPGLGVLEAGKSAILACVMAEKAAPPPPPPSAPTVSIKASPGTIWKGESAEITVCGTNFSHIVVSPLGEVLIKCETFKVRPTSSTKYCATAFGLGGTAQACDDIVVKEKDPPPPARTILRVHSDPMGMEAKVWMKHGEEWIPIGSGITNFIIDDAEPGLYRVRYIDPGEDQYLPTDLTIEVPEGKTTTALGVMKRKE